MKIFGFEKLSLVDYEKKLACTVFTGGCNFLCPFCHNSSLVVLKGTAIDEAEVLSYVEKRKKMLDAVCISGGEPTLQADLREFIVKIKDVGLEVKLDTNGSNSELLFSLIADNLLDYVAMDVKNSLDKYPLTVNLKNPPIDEIKKSAEILMNGNIDYEFRTTLIDEFHRVEDFEAVALWLKGAKRYFLQKFIDSENCLYGGLHAVERKKAEGFAEILRKSIGEVSLRGY